jgi:hypothetical protein
MSAWEQLVETLTDAAHRSEYPNKFSASTGHGAITISHQSGAHWAKLTPEENQLTHEDNVGNKTHRVGHYKTDGDQIMLDEHESCSVEDFAEDVILHHFRTQAA